MPAPHPPEFRRRAVELARERTAPVAQVAKDLGISESCLRNWMASADMDEGRKQGLTSDERKELVALRRDKRRLETENEILRRAAAFFAREIGPNSVPAGPGACRRRDCCRGACRVLGVSASGFYEWRGRGPSARQRADEQLTEAITAIHQRSRGSYGSPRVHAELRLGQGLRCGRKRVARLMSAAGLTGACRRRKGCTIRDPAASPHPDLVNRQFTRPQPDQLWVTDITEHPTREGKVYCAVVLDAFSRRVVGWSIDSSQTAGLVTSALAMAIGGGHAPPGAVFHSDRGAQDGFNRSSQHRFAEPTVGAR